MQLLERQTVSPNFWDNQDEAKRVQRQLGQLQDLIGVWEKNFTDLEEAGLIKFFGRKEIYVADVGKLA